MKKNGFTLFELMVVMVIVGILAVFFIPSMKAPLERGRAKNAEFNLLAIYAAQKRYFLSERKYYLCNNTLESNGYDISWNLSIKIKDPYFYYDIRAEGEDGYKAMAIRKDGICKNMQMSLTADNSAIDKRGCSEW
jgi:prepilin-type N-terminal cleavage/methylation domain-containing protein